MLGKNFKDSKIQISWFSSRGEVIGRQKLNVKICSCPARDMKKDEESISEKPEAGCSRRTLSLMEKNVAHRAGKRMRLDGDNDPNTLIASYKFFGARVLI